MRLFERVARSLRYGTLDYRHTIRDFLAHNENTKEIDYESIKYFIPLARSGFDYYKKYYQQIQQDKSLKTVTSLCNVEDLTLNTDYEDLNVTKLARKFNQIINSDRDLYKCYDCGTNARALFLSLINTHRGTIELHPKESERLDNMYRPNSNNPSRVIDQFLAKAKSVPSDTVFICSLGLGRAGHVWIVEKRFINGRPRFHHYQSCLGSHLVLDYIEYRDYARNPHQSIDMDDFYGKLKSIMEHRSDWTEETKHLFAELFAYLPNNPVRNPTTSFCWTYVTYDEYPITNQIGGGSSSLPYLVSTQVDIDYSNSKLHDKFIVDLNKTSSKVEFAGDGHAKLNRSGTYLDFFATDRESVHKFLNRLQRKHPKVVKQINGILPAVKIN